MRLILLSYLFLFSVALAVENNESKTVTSKWSWIKSKLANITENDNINMQKIVELGYNASIIENKTKFMDVVKSVLNKNETKEKISNVINNIVDKKNENKEKISNVINNIVDKKNENKEKISNLVSNIIDKKNETKNKIYNILQKFNITDYISNGGMELFKPISDKVTSYIDVMKSYYAAFKFYTITVILLLSSIILIGTFLLLVYR